MLALHRRQALRAFAATLPMFYSGACRRHPVERGRTVATLWFSYGGKVREVLLDLIEQFHRSQTHYTIEATYQGDYFESLAKLRTALAAGVGPSFSHVVGEVIPYLERAQVLEPLSSYDGSSSLSFVPALGQAGSYSEGAKHPLVAIPFNRSVPILYVNTHALKEQKVQVPTTWSELYETALSLTQRQNSGIRWGYEVPIHWWFWVALLEQAGGSVVDGQGNPTLGGKAGERALEHWQQLVHTYKAMRPPPGRDYNAFQAVNQDFLTGRVAMVCTSTAFLRYLEENAPFPVLAAPLPIDQKAAAPTGGTHFVILRSAPQWEKEAAWAFLKWMCLPEQTAYWAMRTGYFPVTQEAVSMLIDSGFYSAHPNDWIAYKELVHAQPWPWAPTLFRIQREVVEPRLEDAILYNRDAREVFDEARQAAKDP